MPHWETAVVTTAPGRDRALGRGVSQLIPQPGAHTTAADAAAAALAALRTAPVQVGVLQAATTLLEAIGAGETPDEAVEETAAATAALLRAAMQQAQAG